MRLGDHAAAAEAYEQVIAVAGDAKILVEAHLMRGEALFTEQEDEPALAEFATVLEAADEATPEQLRLARWRVATIQHRQGRTDEAEKTLRELAEDPDAGWMRKHAGYLLGELLFRRGSYQEAEAAFAQALEDVPLNEYQQPQRAALFRLGQCAYEQGDFMRAVAELEHLAALPVADTYRVNALLLLNSIGLEMGDCGAAEQRYQALVAAAPEDSRVPEVLLGVGSCYEEAGEPAKAVEYLAALAAEFPEHVQGGALFLELGRLYREVDDEARALEAYARAAESSDPVVSSQALVVLAKDRYQRGQWHEALELARRVTERPGAPDQWVGVAWSWQGAICEGLEDWEGALAAYEGVLRSSADPVLRDTARSRMEEIARYLDARRSTLEEMERRDGASVD